MTVSADDVRIATCMIGFPPTDRGGIPMAEAGDESWAQVFAEVAAEGFAHVEVSDGWLRVADLDPARIADLRAVAYQYGIALPSAHIQRVSVVQPGHSDENTAYLHRSLEAVSALGAEVFSTGLHQPFTPAQQRALWFWTAPGPVDPPDGDVWELAVSRIRDLGRRAADLGLRVALELYEDTYLGTADGAVRFVEAVGLDNVGLNPDVGNLIRLHRPVEDWRELYAKTLPYANYWHLKNYARDEAADGSWYTATPSTLATGVVNYREVIAQAVALGYDGIFTCEHYGGDSLSVCGENAAYIRRMVANADRRLLRSAEAVR